MLTNTTIALTSNKLVCFFSKFVSQLFFQTKYCKQSWKFHSQCIQLQLNTMFDFSNSIISKCSSVNLLHLGVMICPLCTENIRSIYRGTWRDPSVYLSKSYLTSGHFSRLSSCFDSLFRYSSNSWSMPWRVVAVLSQWK